MAARLTLAINLIGATGVAGLLALGAMADQPKEPPAVQQSRPNRYHVSGVVAIDGDTIRGDVALGFDVSLTRQTIRLAGFDAWELTRHRRTVEITDDELARGEKAKAELERIIHAPAATPYLIPEGRGRDAYGRLLARLVTVGGDGVEVDVAQHMRASGHDRGGVSTTEEAR